MVAARLALALAGGFMRTILVVCGVLFMTAARASDASVEAAASYAVETTGSTSELPAGGVGRLVLEIRPRPQVHVQRQAPLRAKLASTSGLALAKVELGRENLVDASADAPRFEVPFTATTSGKQEVRARLDFFVCSTTWCVRQEREVSWVVEVR